MRLNRSNKKDEKFIKKVKDYLIKGWSYNKIKKTMKCSSATIAKIAKESGIGRARRIKLESNYHKNKFLEDYLNGDNEDVIAKRYGYAVSTVISALSRLGAYNKERTIVQKEEKYKRRCNICGKRFITNSKYARFCNSCRRLASNWDYQEYSLPANF